MSKQPYIPIYIGDYLKDTRVLPLAVRGAWVDLILFMWDSPVRGELIATAQEIARMIGCDTSEATFALNLLKQKKTANIDLLDTGEYKIVSRRMKKDAEISAIRSEVGKKGVGIKLANTFAKAKPKAKEKQNTDIDIDNDIENNNDIIIPFKSERFLQVWRTWLQFRSEIGKPYKSKISNQAALKKLSLYSEDVAIKMIEQSIANSWQGLFEIKENNNGKFNKNGHHLTEEGTRKRLDSYTND